MSSSARSRVELQEHLPEPTSSRPLKTGKHFLLVLPARRLVSATWDRARYHAGDVANLTVSGRGLGEAPLQLSVEAEREAGVYAEVAVVPAEVEAGGKLAQANFALPAARAVRTRGQVVEAHFSAETFAPGEEVALQVAAEGLAGEQALLEVEREGPGGVWEPVAQLQISLDAQGGEARWKAPGAAAAAAAPDSCSFAKLGPGVAWLRSRAPALEGKMLQFVLEREEAPGHFVEVGQAVASVRSGEAEATVSYR